MRGCRVCVAAVRGFFFGATQVLKLNTVGKLGDDDYKVLNVMRQPIKHRLDCVGDEQARS